MLILQWEFWLGSGIALMLGAALGRLWCSRALAVAEDDLAALEEVLWYRMRVERQIREALGLGDIGGGQRLQHVGAVMVEGHASRTGWDLIGIETELS